MRVQGTVVNARPGSSRVCRFNTAGVQLAHESHSRKHAQTVYPRGMEASAAAIVPLDAYVKTRHGAATASASMLCWFPSPRLRVMSIWGRPGPEDVHALVRVLEHAIQPATPR